MILMTPGGKAGWSRGRAGPGLKGTVRSVSERGGHVSHPAPEQGQHKAKKGPAAQRAHGQGGGPKLEFLKGKVSICFVSKWFASAIGCPMLMGLLGRQPP